MKLAGEVPVLVKLQRPPPDMRIFLPGLLAWSSSSTRRPRAPASAAHIRPAAPAPTITTSVLSISARRFWPPGAVAGARADLRVIAAGIRAFLVDGAQAALAVQVQAVVVAHARQREDPR